MAALSREVPMFLAVVLLVSCNAAPTDILYRVPEEQPPNMLIGSLAADRGLPDTGRLYKLEIGLPYLRVDGKTGNIYTTEIPTDRETLSNCRNLFDGDKCFLEFEVSITDMVKGLGIGPRVIEGRIEVLDINDNTPVIEIRGIGSVTHQDGVANISEDIPIGYPVALVTVSRGGKCCGYLCSCR